MSSPSDDPHTAADPAEADDLVAARLREWTGCIYTIPDKLWGIELVVSDGHPGACLGGDAEHVCFVQGTDAEHDWRRRSRERVLPSETNGLYKETSFRIEPRRFRWNRVVLFHPERFVGRLEDDDFTRLRERLERLLDPEAGH